MRRHAALAMTSVGLGQADYARAVPAQDRRERLLRRIQRFGDVFITTPDGHILINSEPCCTVPLIQKSVESLGSKWQTSRFCFASHAHPDQWVVTLCCRSHGRQGLCHAATTTSSHRAARDNTCTPWPAVGSHARSTAFEDREEVKLGGVTLVARLTPGHTRGCTTWTWQVEDGGKEIRRRRNRQPQRQSWISARQQ